MKTEQKRTRKLARWGTVAAALGIALAAPGPAATPTTAACIPVPPQLTPAWGSGDICTP